MKKLFLSALLWTGILCLATPLSAVSQAEASTSFNLVPGKGASGTLTEEDREHIYQVQVSEAGKLTVNVSSYFENVRITLLDANQKTVWNQTSVYGKENDPAKWTESVNVEAGTYTLKIKSGDWGTTIGDYMVSTEFTAAKNTEQEPNNGTEIAELLTLNQGNVRGFLSWSDSEDYYKVELHKAGTLTAILGSYLENVKISLIDSDGEKVWGSPITYGKENDPKKWSGTADLEPGDYFIKVERGDWGDTTGVYTIGAEFKEAGNNESEPNNGTDIAQTLSLNGTGVKGFLSWNDAVDYYTFTLAKSSRVKADVSSYTEHIDFVLYNEDKEKLADENITYGKENDPKKWSDEYELPAGTYFVKIGKGDWGKGTGVYTLALQDTSLMKNFTDVSGAYKEAVDYLVRENIAGGISDTAFGVSNKIKRADAAVMIAKALQLDTQSAKNAGFKDVPARAQGAVNVLAEKGILNGKSKTAFGANDPLTRGEMALILTRAYQLDGSGITLQYKDVSPRYEAAVKALVKNHITSGKSKTVFGTNDSITRGEMAILLYRKESQ